MLNIAANYIGTAVNTVVPFVAIPFYVSLLGERAWGLVSTILLIQSILYFSEAGISQISSIEFSRLKSINENSTKVIIEYELIYWIIALVMSLLIIIASSLFALFEIFGKYTAEEFLVLALGASFIFMAQFPAAVYKSVLMNTERQIQFNKVSVFFTLLRHGVTIVSLYAHPSLYVFLVAIFSMTIFETAVRRRIALQGTEKFKVQIKVAHLRQMYAQSLGPAITVIIGMLTTQIDKVLGAIILTPEEYGRYALASTLAQGCITVTQPIIQAISPKILQHKIPSVSKSLASSMLLKYLLLINSSILFLYWLFGDRMIEFWLQSSAVAESVQIYFNVLIWGAILNSIYHVNYFNILSEQRFKQIFWINVFGLLASTALIPVFVREFGVHWIGFAFVLPNIIAILATTFRSKSVK